MSDQPLDPSGPEAHDASGRRVCVVTGLSGAGRGTAMRVLEDGGWEAVDNLPLDLLPALLAAGAGARRPLALGADTRTRGFSAEALVDAVSALRAAPDVAPTLIFMDAADGTLITRYLESRRRHPMAPEETVADGVARERAMLQAVRDRADLVIDTTDLTPHDLKARLRDWSGEDGAPGLSLSVQSFSYKRGAPREADMVIDCRFLRNPHWTPALRPRDGRDPEVAAYVAADPLFARFFNGLAELVAMLLPAYKREGKAYFGIALGCSGGRHRSVALAERLAGRLSEEGWRVNLRHRELEGAEPAQRESGAPS